MLTIGRRHKGPRRDYQTDCKVCGVNWLRSQLRRNANGVLVCPDDIGGRVETELDRLRHPPFGIPIVGTTVDPFPGDPSPQPEGGGGGDSEEETSEIEATHVTYITGTDEDPIETAAFTATTGNLYLIAITHYKCTIDSVTSSGLTWQLVTTVDDGAGPALANNISVYRAMATSTGSNTCTILPVSGGGATGAVIASVTEVTTVNTSGSNGAGAIVQSASNSTSAATSITVSLSNFQSTDNATFGAMCRKATSSETITAGDGFTRLISTGGALMLNTQWFAGNDTSVDWSWTTAATALGIAIELKAAA